MDRSEAITRIRKALKERSGKSWSVTGGRGTAWGWIDIKSPPKRRVDGWAMSPEDMAELSALLCEQVSRSGVAVPESSAYRIEYVDRAEGREPTVYGTRYWD